LPRGKNGASAADFFRSLSAFSVGPMKNLFLIFHEGLALQQKFYVFYSQFWSTLAIIGGKRKILRGFNNEIIGKFK